MRPGPPGAADKHGPGNKRDFKVAPTIYFCSPKPEGFPRHSPQHASCFQPTLRVLLCNSTLNLSKHQPLSFLILSLHPAPSSFDNGSWTKCLSRQVSHPPHPHLNPSFAGRQGSDRAWLAQECWEAVNTDPTQVIVPWSSLASSKPSAWE